MKLNYRTIGEGEPIIILHGLFGSIDNWHSIAKRFVPEFQVYLVEQRNHGKSPHSDEFNYQVMADDLKTLMDDLDLKTAHLIGHSMGGKTAMNFACLYPSRVLNLIVVDIAPKAYPPHHQHIFEGFESLDLKQLQSRTEADKILSLSIPDLATRQFLLKNLARNGQGFEWRLNLPGIRANIDCILEELPPEMDFDGRTLFIGGAESSYILNEDRSLINYHFPNSSVVYIQGAGHWVHAQKPDELTVLVQDFLSHTAYQGPQS